jgi:CHAD domain-containing protein
MSEGPDLPPAATEPAAVATLSLSLHPDDVPLLLRQPGLRRSGARRGAHRCSLVWHDTADSQLAERRLALALRHEAAQPALWELTRLVADSTDIWPPGAPAPVLATAATQEALGQKLPAGLLPLAAFEGTSRVIADTPALRVVLLEGSLRAVTATSPVCRLELSGPQAAAQALAWSDELRLAAPPDSLAAEAYRLARPSSLPLRPLGPPTLPPTLDVEAGFAFVTAHLAGVLLAHGPGAIAEAGPEPVHQMRVAVRRLRSAILLFRRAVSCPELDVATQHLKALGRVLGPPRDWDVFTRGTGAAVSASFPDDEAVRALLAASVRRRKAGYAALRRHLAGPGFRALGIALAALAVSRSWRLAVPDDPAAAEKRAALQRAALADYAARALSKRLAVVTAPGADLAALAPEALHDIRLHVKRLRYAAEFFSPLFPGRETRRFLRRMAAVQERLGHLNDSTVAAGLMAELPRGGASRAYAVGVVRGFVAARAAGGRRKMERSWQRFLKLEPFWT